MAVYSETIELDDGVSSEAKAAKTAMGQLSKGLEAAQANLVKIQALGDESGYDKALVSVGRYAAAIEKLKSTSGDLLSEGSFSAIPANHPALAAAGAPSPAASGEPAVPAIPADFKASAETNAAAVDQLKGALASANTEMAKAAALGDAEGFAAAKADADQYQAALAKLPPVVDAIVAKPVAPALEAPKDAEGWKSLTKTIQGMQEELHSAEAEMQKAQALGDGEGFAEAKKKADGLKDSLAKLPKVAPEVKKEHSEMWEKAAQAAIIGKESIGQAISGIKEAFASLAEGDVAGALKGVTESIAGMAKMLDFVVPGLGELVSVVVEIAGGVAGAFVSMTQGAMKMAISASQAKQQMLSMFDALGDGVVTGQQVDDMLDEMSEKIGISKEKLAPLTKEFLKMGVTGQDQLEKLTKAAISATAIVGEGGGEAFAELTKKIQAAAQSGGTMKLDDRMLRQLGDAGVHVADLKKAFPELGGNIKGATLDAKKLGDAMTDSVIARGAKPLERMSLSWDSLRGKLEESIGKLFEDLSDSTDPFMEQVKSLFDIFDQANPSGQALKDGIGVFLREAFAQATKLVPLVKNFLLDVIIYGLKAYIALKPIVKSVREFFASSTGSAILSTALGVVVSAFKAVGVVLLLVVGLFATLMAASIAVGVAIWGLIGTVISFGVELLASIGGTIADATKAFSDWAAKGWTIASDFVSGLVGGITGGIGKVVDSVTNLGSSALSAIKGVFDSHSPSKVTMGIGGDVGDGLVLGMGAAANDVHAAGADMASLAVAGTAAGASGSAGAGAAAASAAAAQAAGSSSSSGSGGVVITLEAGAISISGQGKDWSEVTEEMISSVMERLGMAVGAA